MKSNVRGRASAINLAGLPAPLVQALQTMAQALRTQPRGKYKLRRSKLPLWRGKTKGKLRRRDIYGDVA